MKPAAPIWGVYSGCFLVAIGPSPEEAFKAAVNEIRRAVATDPDLDEDALDEFIATAILVRLHVMTTDPARAEDVARELFRVPERQAA